MMPANATYISPIVTAEEAEDLNRSFCNAIGDPRLFLFCHYQPIPDNPQEPTARYIPNVLNLFVFVCDSCFSLADGETRSFLLGCNGFSEAGKIFELKEALKIILRSVKDIHLLRACLAHNTSDDNGNYVARYAGQKWTFIDNGKLTSQRTEYETWVKSVIEKPQPETKPDYEKLCAKLEDIKKNLVSNINTFISCVKALSVEYKKTLIQHWEERIIDHYSTNPTKQTSMFFNQLISIYFSIAAGKSPCTKKDIEAWIESSVGYIEECHVKQLKGQKRSLEVDVNKCKMKLQFKKTEGDAEAAKTLQGFLNGLEKELSECQSKLTDAEKELNTIIKESQNSEPIAYFCKKLKSQLSQTLMLEHHSISSLLPEVFLQAHINRTFPEPI